VACRGSSATGGRRSCSPGVRSGTGERGEALPVAGRARSAGGRIVSRAGPLELGSEAADGGEQPGCEVVGAAGGEPVDGHPVEFGVGVGLAGWGHLVSWVGWSGQGPWLLGRLERGLNGVGDGTAGPPVGGDGGVDPQAGEGEGSEGVFLAVGGRRRRGGALPAGPRGDKPLEVVVHLLTPRMIHSSLSGARTLRTHASASRGSMGARRDASRRSRCSLWAHSSASRRSMCSFSAAAWAASSASRALWARAVSAMTPPTASILATASRMATTTATTDT